MSEPPPPADPGGTPGGGPPLTAADAEAALAAFRDWLAAGPPPPADAPPPVDLHTLAGQFTALRHEVNLQTRAARAQSEQAAEALAALKAAPRPAANGDDSAARALLKALVDVYDALALAAREVERAPDALADALAALEDAGGEPPPEVPPARPGLFARFSAAADPAGPLREWAAARQELLDELGLAGEQAAAALESLRTGYRMGLKRAERALEQAGAEVMACAGRPFDPERMEAVEVVGGTGRPGGEVIDEVRRGYLWRGQVFRYAQVRVAKD